METVSNSAKEYDGDSAAKYFESRAQVQESPAKQANVPPEGRGG